MPCPPLCSTLFPYTTLFRSELGAAVDVYMSLGEEQLLLRVLSLLEREDESVLLTLAADEPGAISWAYLPAGGNDITLFQLPVKCEGSNTTVANVSLISYVLF